MGFQQTKHKQSRSTFRYVHIRLKPYGYLRNIPHPFNPDLR